MDALTKHQQAYKQALKSQQESTILQEKAWLTTAVATSLLAQDTKDMQQMRASLADLSILADRFDLTGKPGDRWRGLSDMLTQALESGKPLQQLRMVLPSTITGLCIQHIRQQPGITPTELANNLNKTNSHISNELKKLESGGLIYRLKRGKGRELFLSVLGKEALESIAPVKVVKLEKKKSTYFYADPTRVASFEQNGGAPALPL